MGGEPAKKLDEADKTEKAEKPAKKDGAVTPFPDATQQVMKGLKPKAIEAVETEFEKVLKLKEQKAKTDAALKDQKERLYETMKENSVPSYGYKHGKQRWIADISEEPKLVVKKAKNDRD